MTTQRLSETYRERTHDAAKEHDLHGWIGLTGRIDLDAFQLMTQDGRRALWARASDDDKLGLVLQILRARGEPFDSDDLHAYLEALEIKFHTDALPITPEPPAEIVQIVASRGAAICHEHGDYAGERATNKAALHLASGVEMAWANGDLLIGSGTRAGVVHRVRNLGGTWSCSCEAARNGRGCWHVEAAEIVTTAQAWWIALLEEADAACELVSEDGDGGDEGGQEAESVAVVVTTIERRDLGVRLAVARAKVLAA
jgi:hypothetical protein